MSGKPELFCLCFALIVHGGYEERCTIQFKKRPLNENCNQTLSLWPDSLSFTTPMVLSGCALTPGSFWIIRSISGLRCFVSLPGARRQCRGEAAATSAAWQGPFMRGKQS